MKPTNVTMELTPLDLQILAYCLDYDIQDSLGRNMQSVARESHELLKRVKTATRASKGRG